jgi:uncharacterized protein (TIGR03437 family)
VGGTGAFLGARGVQVPNPTGSNVNVTAAYVGSMTEDPANRRLRGGGPAQRTLSVIPMFWPEVVMTDSGPAVVHASDGSLVSSTSPARVGEVLTLYATGLGPTRPALDPGQVFAADPPQTANSPIDIDLGGQAAEVLYAAGVPGSSDNFQVNFRVPEAITPGMVSLKLSAAWITGHEVKIAIQ